MKEMGNIVRPVNVIGMSPLLIFIGSQMGSLVRGDAVWTTAVVNKAFCESMVVLAEVLPAGKANPHLG